MHSIRIRIMTLTMTAILISILALGSTSIISIRRKSDRDSEEMMRLLCDNCSHIIDDYLSGIEQSEDVIVRYAVEELDTLELVDGGAIGADGFGNTSEADRDAVRQQALDAYLDAYLERLKPVFHSVANRTSGVITFYYRINPEISTAQQGFLYSRIGSASFTEERLTRLDKFTAEDTERTGWYYLPLQRGRPSWLEPYNNKNLGMKMISYVSPIYKAGTFIGVIGMDIGYETLIRQIRDIRIYESGFAFLIEKDGTVVYHPHLESGLNLREQGLEIDFDELGELDRNLEPLHIRANGEDRRMFFNTLSNGLKLVVSAPVREINKSGRQLASDLVVISIVILLAFSSLTAVLMRRLTTPLKRLTAAAEGLADGNYDVQLDYTEDNEIGVLTRTFQQLVEHLRIHISDLNSKAYQDAMTGVRNKAAYNISEQKLNDAIRMAGAGEALKFALVMFDCNDLKQINDNYGHEKGDAYLCKACKLICEAFPHSPVFRIGGDEFAVLLQSEQYERREELLASFDRMAADVNAKAREPWELARVARGIAAFEPGADKDVESVLRRADERMYENKHLLKEAEANEMREVRRDTIWE